MSVQHYYIGTMEYPKLYFLYIHSFKGFWWYLGNRRHSGLSFN